MITITHRYALLAGHNRHEKNGWRDFKGMFPTAEEAAKYGYGFDWMEIIDMLTQILEFEGTRIDPEAPTNHVELH